LSRQFEVSAADVAGQVKRLRVVAIRSRNVSGEPRVIHLLRELESPRKGDVPRALAGREVSEPLDEVSDPVVGIPSPHLTDRELDVLRLLASGLSTKDIADALGISRITARNHVTRTIEKLEVKSRLQAVIAAGRRGLL
jgi:two-component system NarL family response regulator